MTSNCCGQPLKSKVQMSVYAVFYFFTIFDWAHHSLLWFSSCFPGCPSSVSFVGPSSSPQPLIPGASRSQALNCPPFSLYSLPKWSHLALMALNIPPCSDSWMYSSCPDSIFISTLWPKSLCTISTRHPQPHMSQTDQHFLLKISSTWAFPISDNSNFTPPVGKDKKGSSRTLFFPSYSIPNPLANLVNCSFRM